MMLAVVMMLQAKETPLVGNVINRQTISLNGETLKDEIGFRTIETRGKQLLLNGRPIFLKGISIHEEKPYGGGAKYGLHGAKNQRWTEE